jgi:tetratricopeptide (TPR) repeat protein
MSARGLSDLERGARRIPRRETVLLLTGALNLSPNDRTRLESAAHQHRIPPTHMHSGSTAAFPSNPSPSPFVGRVQELAQLKQGLSDGQQVLFVAGEPGIGKSRLLLAGIEWARAQGWTVLTGGCLRRRSQEPYAPLVDALAESWRVQSSADQRQHARACPWLVRLLPELAEIDSASIPGWSLPIEQERRLMFAAVVRYLVRVAGPAGTLLVLDDLQWACPDALDLLQTVVRTPTDRPLHVLASYRDTDVTGMDPLTFLVADLAREGLASRVLLTPLGEDESAALLEELLPEDTFEIHALRKQVLERAAGVPLFLISCVQGLQSGQLTQNRTAYVPWTLREAILQRIIALQEPAHQVLRLAAVIGRRVPRALLTSLAARTNLAEEALLESLEACERARLLVEVNVDDYQFTHDLIREVILSDLSTARRAVIHRWVAEALETTTPLPSVSDLAYHYAQSDQQEKAIIYLEQAGDAARARYAHTEAENAYREVIARLEMLGSITQAAAVEVKLGIMLARQGRYDEALIRLERACEVFRTEGDLEREVRVLAQIGRIHFWRGTSQQGLSRLMPQLGRLTQAPASKEAAAFYVALAYLYMGAGQYNEQLAAAEQAATIARSLGEDALLTTAQERHAAALLMVGRLVETCRVLTEEVIPASEASGKSWTLILALETLIRTYEYLGDYKQARACLDQGLSLAERIGDPVATAHVLYRHGLNAFALGEWKQARSDFEQAATLVGSTGQFLQATYPPHGLGLLCLAEGREEEAVQYLTQALAFAHRNYDMQVLCVVQGLLAEWDLLAGRVEDARVRLFPLLETPGPLVSFSKEALAMLAWAYLELGDREQAQKVITQVIRTAQQAQMYPTLVQALRVQALVLSKEGNWEEAEQILQEAQLLCRKIVAPYAEAKVLYTTGVISYDKGELVSARQRFEAALEICAQLGERLYASRMEQALAELL